MGTLSCYKNTPIEVGRTGHGCWKPVNLAWVPWKLEAAGQKQEAEFYAAATTFPFESARRVLQVFHGIALVPAIHMRRPGRKEVATAEDAAARER